ncbi:MAG: hypothetical protein V7K47_03850 [Nostoc sp.]
MIEVTASKGNSSLYSGMIALQKAIIIVSSDRCSDKVPLFRQQLPSGVWVVFAAMEIDNPLSIVGTMNLQNHTTGDWDWCDRSWLADLI